MREQMKHYLLIKQSEYLRGLKSTDEWIEDMGHHGENVPPVGTRADVPHKRPVVVIDLEEVGR